MRIPRSAAAPWLMAVAVLSSCGGAQVSESPSPSQSVRTTLGPPTTARRTATTTAARTPAALQAALLTPADVPASTPLPPTPGDVDLSSCLPGNPLGVRIDPNEVAGPDLEVVQGTVTREYSSAARQATPEQASAFVANLATAAGSACAVNVLKASVSSDPPPPKVDPAGLTGAVTPLAIGDGAALLALTGNLTVDVTPTPTGVELLAFRKGSVVVIVSAVAMQGPTIAGQTVELALKVAGRLS